MERQYKTSFKFDNTNFHLNSSATYDTDNFCNMQITILRMIMPLRNKAIAIYGQYTVFMYIYTKIMYTCASILRIILNAHMDNVSFVLL